MRSDALRIDQDRQGYLTILALFTLTGIATIAVTGLSRTMTEQLAARTEVATHQAFHLAEAGLDMAITEVTLGGTDGLTNFSLDEGWMDATNASCESGELCTKTLPPLATGMATVTVDQIAAVRRTIRSTGTAGGSRQTLEVVIEAQPSPFQQAIFTARGISTARDVFIDSYDSTVGPYLPTTPHPPTGLLYQNANGDVRTDATQSGGVTLGEGTAIFGQIIIPTLDPYGNPVDPNAVVRNPQGAHHEGIVQEPAWNLVAESVPASLCNATSRQANLSQILNGAGNIPAGTYFVQQCTVNDNQTVYTEGEVTLYCELLNLKTGAKLKGMTSGAEKPRALEIVMPKNGTCPGGLEVNASDVMFGGGSTFVGTVYGPEAPLKFVHPSVSIFGAVIGKDADITQGSKLHYDESLAGGSTSGQPSPVTLRAWRQDP